MTDHSSSDEGWEELSHARDKAIRLTGRFIGRSINCAAALARDTRKAFQQGLDPNIDDAVVLEETEDTDHER